MTFNFKQYRIHQNIKPINLPNSEIFLHDLVNIENGLTGRSDLLNFGNTFINEAVQLLVNSIALFEMGYFDSAYYSLRQAIELSTTLVFLSDIPSEEREQKFEAWKVREHFPLYRDMMQKLSRDGLVFSDMQIKLESFFAHVKSFSNVLNKYVHKQGYRNFYVSRNHPMNKQSSDIFIKNFEQHLEKTIGIVAVMRLAIDPFPVLLMDEEIMYRYFDSLTEPYSFDFVNKYIGEETLNFYKMTDLYKQTYESIIVEEKKCESVRV